MALERFALWSVDFHSQWDIFVAKLSFWAPTDWAISSPTTNLVVEPWCHLSTYSPSKAAPRGCKVLQHHSRSLAEGGLHIILQLTLPESRGGYQDIGLLQLLKNADAFIQVSRSPLLLPSTGITYKSDISSHLLILFVKRSRDDTDLGVRGRCEACGRADDLLLLLLLLLLVVVVVVLLMLVVVVVEAGRQRLRRQRQGAWARGEGHGSAAQGRHQRDLEHGCHTHTHTHQQPAICSYRLLNCEVEMKQRYIAMAEVGVFTELSWLDCERGGARVMERDLEALRVQKDKLVMEMVNYFISIVSQMSKGISGTQSDKVESAVRSAVVLSRRDYRYRRETERITLKASSPQPDHCKMKTKKLQKNCDGLSNGEESKERAGRDIIEVSEFPESRELKTNGKQWLESSKRPKVKGSRVIVYDIPREFNKERLVKRCRERKINIKASERDNNVDVFTQNKRPYPQHSQSKAVHLGNIVMKCETVMERYPQAETDMHLLLGASNSQLPKHMRHGRPTKYIVLRLCKKNFVMYRQHGTAKCDIGRSITCLIASMYKALEWCGVVLSSTGLFEILNGDTIILSSKSNYKDVMKVPGKLLENIEEFLIYKSRAGRQQLGAREDGGPKEIATGKESATRLAARNNPSIHLNDFGKSCNNEIQVFHSEIPNGTIVIKCGVSVVTFYARSLRSLQQKKKSMRTIIFASCFYELNIVVVAVVKVEYKYIQVDAGCKSSNLTETLATK
ncbi:hypothetical protein PR048_024626 [Dryococelus australis]|uniref:Uncharacterized protein n=1 Tax=Dryococelus australis TaxID=614101 RepID=A0ABQ9GP32_9NEOP|nr:hypothetical protein PR048_024626 [Dryococelus australis]